MEEIRQALNQLRVFRLGILKDGDVRIRVFPEAKKASLQSQ